MEEQPSEILLWIGIAILWVGVTYLLVHAFRNLSRRNHLRLVRGQYLHPSIAWGLVAIGWVLIRAEELQSSFLASVGLALMMTAAIGTEAIARLRRLRNGAIIENNADSRREKFLIGLTFVSSGILVLALVRFDSELFMNACYLGIAGGHVWTTCWIVAIERKLGEPLTMVPKPESPPKTYFLRGPRHSDLAYRSFRK